MDSHTRACKNETRNQPQQEFAIHNDRLFRFLCDHPRWFVLSGAGISTDSGIPDYRDEAGRWKRKQPVMVQDFMRSELVRRRYWARSMVGWPVIAQARPNAAHEA